jgi:hypothetical protein
LFPGQSSFHSYIPFFCFFPFFSPRLPEPLLTVRDLVAAGMRTLWEVSANIIVEREEQAEMCVRTYVSSVYPASACGSKEQTVLPTEETKQYPHEDFVLLNYYRIPISSLYSSRVLDVQSVGAACFHLMQSIGSML